MMSMGTQSPYKKMTAVPSAASKMSKQSPHRTQEGDPTKKSLVDSDSMTLSQILGDNKGPVRRQVTEEQGRQFAQEQGLIFLGETSCLNDKSNILDIFYALINEVHETQTDLVKRGLKPLEDIKYGEEERNIRYDRCCY